MAQQNIELGPCRVSIDDTDIGATVGAVRVRVNTIWRDRRSDRYGAAVVDRVALGSEIRVTLRLAEKTMQNLQRALPQAGETDDYLSLGRKPGFKGGSVAHSLRLRPEERADTGRDVVLHKAVATGAVELSYGPGQRRTFEVEFLALVDAQKDDGDRLARIYQAD